MILGKYNQSKTITFDLFKVDGIDLEVAATFAAGDIVIMKDEGAEANTTNLPTDEGTGYSLVLTATEMSAARIRLYIIDQTATKVWLDISIGIETYGNASAEHAFDLDTASTAQTADNDTKLTTLLARIVGTLATGTHYPATAAQIAVLSDWINGGRLDLILDIIAADTTTDIPALIATAQTDLDTITDIDGVILGAAGVDLILDEAISDTVHSTSGTLGNRIYLGQTNSWIASSINDAGATTTAFITNLTSTVTDFYKDQSVFFVTGALSGQSRIISGYNGTTKAITVDEAFTSAPVDTTQFGLGSLHVHPITQIQSGLATEAKQDAQKTVIDNLNSGIIYSSAATGTLTTTEATTALTGYADTQLVGRVMIVLSGNAAGEATDITSYANTGGKLTFTALTVAMANGDTFKII